MARYIVHSLLEDQPYLPPRVRAELHIGGATGTKVKCDLSCSQHLSGKVPHALDSLCQRDVARINGPDDLPERIHRFARQSADLLDGRRLRIRAHPAEYQVAEQRNLRQGGADIIVQVSRELITEPVQLPPGTEAAETEAAGRQRRQRNHSKNCEHRAGTHPTGINTRGGGFFR